MVEVCVVIRRYVDDNQPGWVECCLTDAYGREWLFIEKVPLVTVENLDSASIYPRPGVIACQVIDRRVGTDEREVIVIDTKEPWLMEATTGDTRFEVRPEQLRESDRKRELRPI